MAHECRAFRRKKKMAARKARTAEEKERSKDLRLQRKYGITLARQNEIRAEQSNRCKTCQVEFTDTNPPCTDHFHFRVVAEKFGKKNWRATGIDERGLLFAIISPSYPTKQIAVDAIKKIMAPRSVRGLLCRKCNRGLGYIERFFDAARHPENLLPVVEYLQACLKKS